jgi:hypothetical protein
MKQPSCCAGYSGTRTGRRGRSRAVARFVGEVEAARGVYTRVYTPDSIQDYEKKGVAKWHSCKFMKTKREDQSGGSSKMGMKLILG